jgi:predicted nucleotidyltransferase
MRTEVPTLLPLFRSEFQLRLLALLLLPPRRTWTASQLQEALDAPAASVHRELQRALRAGVLRREEVGRTFQYAAAEDSPVIDALSQLLERTVGIEGELRLILDEVGGVDAAVVHGSYATRARIKPDSDIDLLVIGKSDLRALRTRLRRLERRIGRQIDAQVFSADEFRDMLARGNSFARSVVSGPSTPLTGNLTDAISE